MASICSICKCRVCGGKMGRGKAITPTLSTSSEGTTTQIPGKIAVLVDVCKCEKCGHSFVTTELASNIPAN